MEQFKSPDGKILKIKVGNFVTRAALLVIHTRTPKVVHAHGGAASLHSLQTHAGCMHSQQDCVAFQQFMVDKQCSPP